MKSNRRSSIWKKTLGALAVGASTLLLTLPAVAQDIHVFVDSKAVNFGGVPPTTQNGRLLVPLRSVFEALGAIVDYNVETRTIDALRGSTRLKITLGSNTAFVNDQPVRLDTPAQTSLGRTLVPLRFVGEAFGAQVDWNPSDQTVVITSPAAPPRPTQPKPVTPPTEPKPPVETTPPTPELEPIEEAPIELTRIGTLVAVSQAQPARITIRSDNVEHTYTTQRGVTVERRPLRNRSTPEDPDFGTPTEISLGDIQQGEAVEITLDERNIVRHITAMPSVTVARVLSTSRNRIVLDDEQQTTFTIGSNLRYIDPRGRSASTAALREGDEIVLFVSPETRRVYQLSASQVDLSAALGRDTQQEYLPPVDNGAPSEPVDRAVIDLVTLSTSNENAFVAKEGDRITINVRGTAGLRGTFDLSDRIRNLPLRERPQLPGNYFAQYTVKKGDELTNGRATVRLSAADGQETTHQSLDSITIDTQAPTVIGTKPLAGTTIDNSRPNIVVYAEELGSGLAPSTITITNAGESFEVRATADQRMSVSAIPDRDLRGRVDVAAEIRDEAGNSTTHNFSFTVSRGTEADPDSPIRSIFHNANRVLRAGDKLTVDMIAEPGGRASYDLVNENGQVVARDIAMTSISNERGRYRGEYTVQGVRDAGVLRVVGHFADRRGRSAKAEATTTVEVLGEAATLAAPRITSPTEGEAVGENLVVQGRGTPGSIINVTVRAEGTQFYVLPYIVELTAPTVRVRGNGRWETAAIKLPSPRNVSGLRFIISAIETDNADRSSEASTITVRPQ